jgi:putative ABC transport system ATP-binding protein
MIRIERLNKQYSGPHGERPVLRDLSLTLADGESLAILGKSGSGKSTLLSCIGGLDRAWTGSIEVAGRRLESLRDAELSHMRGASIGFVFQTPTFLGHLNSLKNLSLAARFCGASDDPKRLLALLDTLGLKEQSAFLPDELSGGQRQRLALARALIADPPLLLCDEPTGNLDDETGLAVVDHMMALNRAGRSLLIVTHDARIAARCTRVATLSDGVLKEGAAR